MIITITRKTIPFKEVIVEDLTCPISGRIEPMRLILSKEETNVMGMSVTVAKKCSGRFYEIGTDQIIHPRNWTTEMKSLFQQHQAQNFPVEGAGRRFTLFGKIWIALTIALLSFFAFKAARFILVDLPKQKALKEASAVAPKAGDLYFGCATDTEYYPEPPRTLSSWTWAKIISSNPSDSTAVLQLSTDLPKDYLKPNQVQHSTFDGKTYKVTYKYKNNSIEFKGESFNFTWNVISDINEVKIPGGAK